MRRTLLVSVILVLGALSALLPAQAPRSWTLKDAPAEYQDAAARAMKAFDSVQATLSARLMEEMKAGGPTRAIVVCRDEAIPLTTKIAVEQSGMALGRTSHLVRNPANAPREWMGPFVQKAAGRKAAGIQPVVVDLGNRVGVLRPIGTAGACTTCHGAKASQPEALQRLLAELYPRDQAVGFSEGDVRGFFWAEVNRESSAGREGAAGAAGAQEEPAAQAQAQPQPARTMRPVISGRLYAVSSMKPQATEAAVRILEAGGNAFDAAVAGQAVLALVDPSLNGLGSDASTLVYDAKTRQVVSINGAAPAPRLATIDWYKQHNDGKLPVNDGLLSATVPSVIDTWYTLLDRWGTKTFAEVLQPAIEVAEQGFVLPPGLARSMATVRKLQKYPSTMKLYWPGGKAPEAGDVFRNPDAGRLLRRLVEAEKAAAAKGRRAALLAARDRFYKGDIAKEMVAFSEQNGGLFHYDDFAGYTVKIETPVSIKYRGYDIYKNASATQGPAELFALNILEGYDLRAMGLNTAGYIHTSAEALKLAFADREKYLGDADFIRIPFDGLLSKEYAAARRALIDPDKASLELRPGDPSPFTKTKEPLVRPVSVTTDGDADHVGDTSYIAVVDKDRNMVSFEPSLHSSWGSAIVVGDLGIIFNCRGDYYSLVPGEANALEPGKRPRSTLQSTLVMKDGQPYMILGSPGGDDQVMRTMQTLINVIDFGMNIQQAIETPRWSTRAFPASPFPHTMYPGDLSVENRIPEAIQKALLAKGHKLTAAGAWSLGSNAAIIVDVKKGFLSAGADPRVDAYAWAR